MKYGLDPQEAELRAGGRPSPTVPWGVEDTAHWGRLGAGESPLTGGGSPVESVPGDYPAFYTAIARALRDGTAPPVTAEEAAAALDVLEAAALSAHEGITVELSVPE